MQSRTKWSRGQKQIEIGYNFIDQGFVFEKIIFENFSSVGTCTSPKIRLTFQIDFLEKKIKTTISTYFCKSIHIIHHLNIFTAEFY